MSETLHTFTARREVSLHRQIAAHVRGLMDGGQLREGDQLPSTQALASEWGANTGAVQQAMALLVKEGRLWRAPRKGTFVRRRVARHMRVVVYYPEDALSRPSFGFQTALYQRIKDALLGQELVPEAWVDSRPMAGQAVAWGRLAQAADAGHVQAVILPFTDAVHLAWLRKLPLPLAAFTNVTIPGAVTFDEGAFYTLALESLARRACHTVGIVGPVPPSAPVQARCRREAARLGLRWREAWLRYPAPATPPPRRTKDVVAVHQRHGYDAFRAIWKQREHPQGLVVTNDVVAMGVMVAMLELGVRAGRDIQVVSHRNRDVKIFCPMPVTFVDYDTAALAEALVGQVQRQWRGEPAQPVCIAPSLQEE
ncbi:MAG: substrate-binding domain-containing protein [Lentisphaerae bacterium]|nr:substrate-binding domain-containing protein [Lentisphaerota bacterium]